MNHTIFGDYLNRNNVLELIYNYVVYNTGKIDKSVCFGIDGQWGQGKSWIINKLEYKFKGLDLSKEYSNNEISEVISKDYFVFKYNAWELDYYNDPLIAIIVTLFEQLNKINIVKIDLLLQEVITKSIKFLSTICGQICKKILGINIIDSAIKIHKKMNELNDFSKLSMKTDKNSISEDIENLVIVLNELSSYKTIIFIVDEVDRCLPEYAIKTLERLHHIFSKINKSFTIISTDELQLVKSIESTYGNSYDAKKYLEKFIMFSFVLSNGDMDEEEFKKKVQNINDKVGYVIMNSFEWEFIYKILENLNAREKQLIFDRTMISLNTLINFKNNYNDANLLVVCLFISTLNYYIMSKKNDFYLANISPYCGNSGDSKFEQYLKNLFVNINRSRKITNDNKLHFILLILFTKKFLGKDDKAKLILDRCEYFDQQLRKEIEHKIEMVSDYYDANKILS